MAFDPFEITTVHIVYAALGGFIVLFGMFSLFLRERLYIGEACWAFVFGVIIGPYGANVFNPRGWGGGSEDVSNMITLEVARVVLAIGVFAIGVELPKAYIAHHWKSLVFLLGPVMTWGWFVSAGLIYALIPGLSFLSSLAVAACLTPTDPILAAAVVGGKYADKHVPAHLRHLLAAESGCNDGAAFPFLYIALYLIVDSGTGSAIKDWFLLLWLYQVVLGCVVGGIAGYSFRHLMKFCQRRELIDRQSLVAQYISLALFTIGIITILGSDDLLAAFACGTAFAWDGFFNKQTEESVFSSVIDLLFNVAAFVFVGAWMPFDKFQDEALTLSVWRLIVIAILVLLLKRLPVIMALYRWIPDVKTFREAIFSGHFGPIGIGAIFISTLAVQELNKLNPTGQTELLAESIQPIVAFMVLCSVVIHGLSIPSFSLGRRVHTASRTWSRRDVLPEWTNQTRLVDRGDAGIIINHDIESKMERGELSPDEKAALEKERKGEEQAEGSSYVTITDGSVKEKKSMNDQDREQNEEASEENEGGKGGNCDGKCEIISEWREGPHRIIERRASGECQEVQVEVIKNAYSNEPEERKSLHGNKDLIHKLLASHKEKVLHAPQQLEKEFENVTAHIQRDINKGEVKVKDMFSANEHRKEEGDEEEGWASDQSAGDPQSSSPSSQHHKKKQKKPLKLGSAPSARRGRRRSSVHGVAGSSTGDASESNTSNSSLKGSTTEDGSEEPETRGRQAGPGPSSTARGRGKGRASIFNSRPNTAPSSLRNFRLDNVRSQDPQTPRELSPARSVRFAEGQNRSGANTPRSSGYYESTSGPGTPAEGVVGDDKNKVTFDLPSAIKR